MRRFTVPVLLGLLLAVQAASLVVAYRRSHLKVVEVVYRARSAFYAAAVEPLELRNLLEEAAAHRGAEMAKVEPSFSVEQSILTARFALRTGSARDVADTFGQEASVVAARAVQQRVAQNVPHGCARVLDRCTAQPATRPPHASLEGFTVQRVGTRFLPWLRPVDLLAALAYVVALVVWLKGQSGRVPDPRGP